MYFDKSVILMWFLSECHINPHSTIGTWRPWQVEQSLTPPSWICVQDGSKHFIGSHEKSETDESKITMTSWEETEAQRTEVNHLRSQRYSVEKQGSRMVSGQFVFFSIGGKLSYILYFFFNWRNIVLSSAIHASWYHRLNGHEFEQAPGVGDRQGSLECCRPWGRKE